MKILIAEDDAATRLRLQATLQRAGHEIVATADGRQALAEWLAQPCPLVISDWEMPEMDGLELCRAIREQVDARYHRYTYFILLTAHGGKSNYMQAMDAGVDDFMVKPPDEDHLAARLRMAARILGLREHVHQLEGLLPVCTWCKKIRDEQRGWQPMEAYVAQHSEARVTHGICPECEADFMKKHNLQPAPQPAANHSAAHPHAL